MIFLSHYFCGIALFLMTSGATNESEIEKRMQTRIHEALEATGGSKAEAAKLLGLDKKKLKDVIAHSPDLSTRWGYDEVTPPDDVDSIYREPISPDQERLAIAYEQESKKFRGDFKSLLRPEEIEMALELQRVNKQRFTDLLDIANAGMSVMVPMLLCEAKKVQARLDYVREQLTSMGSEITEERMAMVEEEKSLSAQLLATSNTLRKIQGASFDGARTLALIKYRIKNGGPQKKAKPGFQPIDV